MSIEAKILNRAGDICADGWCQGKDKKVIDGKECRCAVAAIQAAGIEIDRSKEFDAYDAMLETIRRSGFDFSPHLSPIVSEWNDKPDRTQAEVVVMFRKAAEEAKANG
jgi:hypothetical protein